MATQVNDPFQVLAFGPDMTVSFRMNPASRPLHFAQNLSVEGRWVALPALEVEDGFLQMLADLTSDHRVLVLYDRNGELVNAVPIEAPIGLAASNVESRTLMAVRRLNRMELVCYGWHRGR